MLLENYQLLRPAFGSHNLRSLSHALACAKQLKVPDGAFELQMLYGMGDLEKLLMSAVLVARRFGASIRLDTGLRHRQQSKVASTAGFIRSRQSFKEFQRCVT